jgi:hypothetical protein
MEIAYGVVLSELPWNYFSVDHWYIVVLTAAARTISFSLYCNCLPPWRAFPCYCGFVSISTPVCPWQVLLLYRMECFTPPLTSKFIILTLCFNTTFFNVSNTETSGISVLRRAQSETQRPGSKYVSHPGDGTFVWLFYYRLNWSLKCLHF